MSSATSQYALALGSVRQPTPRLLREARALARPVLKALERGKLSAADFGYQRGGGRRRQHPVVECLARVLQDAPDYDRVSRLGVEKDGVILAGGIAFKIGHRAEVEADLYASHPDKHDILAECVKVAPCIVAMERATPVRDLSDEEGEPYYSDEARSSWRKRMDRFTCDAHEGNVGRTDDGRWVLIDYSFDVPGRNSSED